MSETDPRPTDAETAEAMAHQPYEPLAAAEVGLIVGSLALGLALLGLLLWLSATFFPVR